MSRHIPRKRFGQNFLQDPRTIEDIVDAVNPARDDLVVEIGPGLGAITRPLLARLNHLHVVEIDRDIIARLRRTFTATQLTIHEGDALAFDFAALGTPLKIVGNLPYNISTPLLFHLASFGTQVTDMHFMLQKEVVDRMVAEPGTADYGRLSVMLQYRFYMERMLDVPPEAFDPPPGTKVTGSRCGARKNSPCSAATSTSTAAVIRVACERVAVLPQGSQATASRASALSSRADSQ